MASRLLFRLGRIVARSGGVALGLGLLAAPAVRADTAPDLSKPNKSLSLSSVTDRQRDPARARLEFAVGLLRSERYEEAATQLHALLDAAGPLGSEVKYHLGKALYRLGAHHSALGVFRELLRDGAQSRFYASSLEWCLFLSRKMVAAEEVDETVAQYADLEFPQDYRDEFLFRLSRFHYARALKIETGALAGKLGETRVEEAAAGGMSIQGDLFGDAPEAPQAPAAPKGSDSKAPGRSTKPAKRTKVKEAEPAPKVRAKEGGGLSIDADLFGDEPSVPKPPPEAPAKTEEPSEPGRYVLTAKEHTAAAERLVAQVAENSKWGAKAKFLEGLLLYKQNKSNEALEAFKKVVRLTKEGENRDDAKLREAAFFQLARTHFGAQQPSFSIFYYDKVERETWAWLDALYESSWAEFRLGSYEKALGNLLTLHSPFFKDLYYPESHILKAVIYYENCRYAEAKSILTEFNKRYEPVLEALKRLTEGSRTAAQYYETLQGLRNARLGEAEVGDAELVRRILELALADPELERLDASVAEVDRELALFQASGLSESSLAKAQGALLMQVRDRLAKDAGRAVRNRLEKEREGIKVLLQQAIRVDIETSRSEQERIESELREVQSRPKSRTKTFVEWTDDDKLVWPFDGEYWRDELGTYELTLAHSCR